MDSFNKPEPTYSDPRFNAWGKYATWLADNSPISFRKIGETEWTDTIVQDDRIYYPHNKGVHPGEVHHVTLTTKGSIDFGVLTDGTCSQNRGYEVKIQT